MNTLKKGLVAAMVLTSVALAACGGGGDSGGGSGADATSNNQTANGKQSGGNPGSASSPNSGSSTNGTGNTNGSNTASNNGSSSTTGGSNSAALPINIANIPTDSDNTVPVYVDNKTGSFNMPYVTITVCAPGGKGPCATIDRILVDTGSVGVRISQAAMQGVSAALLKQAGAVDDLAGNNPIAECWTTPMGYGWGSIRRADITIGKRTAPNLPFQVMGDNVSQLPAECTGQKDLSFYQNLGANGVLGIGTGTSDSADAIKSAVPGLYYYCTSPTSCTSTRMTAAKEVANPVSAFSTDFNGTVLSMPAVPATGAATVTGKLIFGIGTQNNNQFPTNAVYLAVDQAGLLTTQYGGMVLNKSQISSGIPTYLFPDSSIAVSQPASMMTPSSTLSLKATIEPTDGSSPPVVVGFSIANATSLQANGYRAYGNIGQYLGNASRSFVWGMPFFYGRDVYTVIGTNKIGTHTGPLIAF